VATVENNVCEEKDRFDFDFPFLCWDSLQSEFVYPNHWHKYYEIVTVLEGSVIVTIDGDSMIVTQNDIVLIDPGQVHAIPQAASDTKLRIYQFDGQLFSKDVHVRERLFQRKPCLRKMSQDEALYSHVYKIIDTLSTEYREKKKGFRLAITSGLCQIALAYLRMDSKENRVSLEKPASFDTEQRLKRVLTLILRDFDHFNLDLDSAAQEAAMSRFHFARFFKRQTGQSFHSYLTKVRLLHAKKLLLLSELSLEVVANKSGFASLSSFHRNFKVNTGCTPDHYRKSNRGNR
jgi:AraC-like DNA-binding protein